MSATETAMFTDREAFVWLGFRRDASLDFKVRLPRDKDECRRILEAVGCYNRFRPEEAFAILDGWWDYVMRFELAREGSVALYVTFPRYQHQAIGATRYGTYWLAKKDMVPVLDSTCEHLASGVVGELLDTGAEELSYDRETRTVRAWWD